MAKGKNRLILRRNMLVVGFILAVIFICGATIWLVLGSFATERRDPFTDIPGVTVETLVELEGDRAYPEAITVGLDAYLYSGSFCTGELWRISPGGELEIWLPSGSGINAASGMAFAPDGTLYIVDRDDCDPRRSISKLKRVLSDKTVEDWGETGSEEILNGLAFDMNGVLYATETHHGQVRTYDENGASVIWWELPVEESLPTGITYDAENNAILVADSRHGTIYRILIDSDGSAGAVSVLFEDQDHALDGLTLDNEGNIIFTSFDNHEVVRLETNGKMTVLARDFREPSDVAYLDGRIYVTNFDGVSLAPVISLIIDPALPFS
ncbi:MAG TPA: SMP-30/gluconolactonase/LRE family protein, partial [Aggregatilineales bacterium]|nr:SMP-30/gluconolactonase/LRE family protein [Aggregatilineales bacterium]